MDNNIWLKVLGYTSILKQSNIFNINKEYINTPIEWGIMHFTSDNIFYKEVWIILCFIKNDQTTYR
jgi:hypothetical protein